MNYNKENMFNQYHIVLKNAVLKKKSKENINNSKFSMLSYWKGKKNCSMNNSLSKSNDNIFSRTEKPSRVNSGKQSKQKLSVIQMINSPKTNNIKLIKYKKINNHSNTTNHKQKINRNNSAVISTDSHINLEFSNKQLAEAITGQTLFESDLYLPLIQNNHLVNDKGVNIKVNDITNKVPNLSSQIDKKKQELYKNMVQFCYKNRRKYPFYA